MAITKIKENRVALIVCDNCHNSTEFRLDGIRSEYMWKFSKIKNQENYGMIQCWKCNDLQEDPFNMWVK